MADDWNTPQKRRRVEAASSKCGSRKTPPIVNVGIGTKPLAGATWPQQQQQLAPQQMQADGTQLFTVPKLAGTQQHTPKVDGTQLFTVPKPDGTLQPAVVHGTEASSHAAARSDDIKDGDALPPSQGNVSTASSESTFSRYCKRQECGLGMAYAGHLGSDDELMTHPPAHAPHDVATVDSSSEEVDADIIFRGGRRHTDRYHISR